jgi:hypothetical protein
MEGKRDDRRECVDRRETSRDNLFRYEKAYTFLQQILFYVGTITCFLSYDSDTFQNYGYTKQMPSHWMLTYECVCYGV